MATRSKTKRKPRARKKKTNGFFQRALGFLAENKLNVIGLVIVLIGALAFFNFGIIGNWFANLVRIPFGNAYRLIWVLLAIAGGFLFVERPLPKIKDRFIWGLVIGFLGYLIFASTMMFSALGQRYQFIDITWHTVMNDLSKGTTKTNVGGGMIGAGLLQLFDTLISFPGTIGLAILLMLTGIVIFFKIPVGKWSEICFNHSKKWGAAIAAKYQRHQLQKQATRKTKVTQQPKKTKPPVEPTPEPTATATVVQDEPIKVEPTPVKAEKAKPTIKMASDNQTQSKGFQAQPTNPIAGDYQLPSTDLLEQIPPADQTQEIQAIDKNTQVLQKTLKSFGVDAEVKNVSLGPSVTEYELHPAIGVKVSKIVHLSDDLALALAAKDIRIEAPIPGKSLIGIEVPNREIATVSFRDTFESQDSKGIQKVLSVPLGKDVNGNVISCDITKMPHLLIAGSTGSGKSVAINGILTSILLKATPDQVKLMLIDPKKVELGVYNGIPHLLSPVVSEPKKAARALNKVVEEMEKRYELFAKTGQRKIDTYNEFVKEQNQKNGTEIPTLPYIVVVVDELADLMMTVSNEVETAIIRLAQMGRAAGVHMILATQRPSVDVITGLIKANVPSRIAFAVSSGTDSRTIIDSNGAEKLLGRGDMLFEPIDQNKPTRIQGSFISDQDVENVVDFVKAEGDPEYDDNMVVTDAEMEQEANDEEKDELFDEALAFVVHEHKASTSMLQRRFRIGYNRAARIIDDMYERGYVGEQRGSTPRTVYKQESSENM
ncbi:FtsK/SpoIIIE family DNA translocase [Fructilactobacillus frigidiflavus]|uniref:FtsK/SpoIIIE family DNA translocase n=1 Tax=Fructilactobacillus frigidiflavus TaxID=3242688 RepID=UPI0037581DB8